MFEIRLAGLNAGSAQNILVLRGWGAGAHAALFCFVLLCFVFVGLKPFWSAQTIAGLCGGGDSSPGINGRRPCEPMPFWPGSTPSAFDLVLTPPANGGHPIPGDDSRSASYPVDDVQQGKMAKGVGDGG